MKIHLVQDQAIAARMALIVGGANFDRLFRGIQFDELRGGILYVYAIDDYRAAEIEETFSRLEVCEKIASRQTKPAAQSATGFEVLHRDCDQPDNCHKEIERLWRFASCSDEGLNSHGGRPRFHA